MVAEGGNTPGASAVGASELVETHVRSTDAFTWKLERDPLLRSTIVAVAVLDANPDWDTLVERVERATRLAPSFRERLVATPLGLATPRWEVDADFDLSWHLRRIAAPGPRDLATVFDLARRAGMAAFDPARPLWEFTLVEGLTDGRAALVLKVHHALTDGIGGIQIAAHVVDGDRQATDLGPLPPAPEARHHGPADRLGEAAGYDARRTLGALGSWIGRLPGVAVTAARHPGRTLRQTVDTATSLGRFVRPITSTRSPVMRGRRLRWHYDALDVPIGPLRAAAKQADGTLNDAFVAGVTGGLRRYHERHGAPVETLRLTMPISVRRDDDAEGGNRVTLVRFDVPVALADPVARMAAIGRLVADRRRERAIPYSDLVAAVLNLLPVSVSGSMLKHVDVLASNVPGFSVPVYLAGARVDAFYPFGPTLGSAANITLMSYRDRCHVGVTTDHGAVPDPGDFLACLREGFEEVLDLGGSHQPVEAVTA